MDEKNVVSRFRCHEGSEGQAGSLFGSRPHRLLIMSETLLLETHPESPPVTALSSFGGPNDRIEE